MCESAKMFSLSPRHHVTDRHRRNPSLLIGLLSRSLVPYLIIVSLLQFQVTLGGLVSFSVPFSVPFLLRLVVSGCKCVVNFLFYFDSLWSLVL